MQQALGRRHCLAKNIPKELHSTFLSRLPGLTVCLYTHRINYACSCDKSPYRLIASIDRGEDEVKAKMEDPEAHPPLI